MKHRIKHWLREGYARLLAHTGLYRLVDRWMPRRLTILAGHCVRDEATNGALPEDMKIGAERLERVLRTLGKRFRLCTVGEGVAELERGQGPSLVALSMDDGYKDNRTALLPLLERTGARATVFLESRPLEERRVNWSHKFFWLADTLGVAIVARRYAARTADPASAQRLRALVHEDPTDLAYRVKLVLKYDVPHADRDATLDELFEGAGGDERALCDRLYLDWKDVHALAGAGVELGGHTRTHAILSRLEPQEARAEVEGGREALVGALGESAGRSFAYPFGRRWDYDETAARAVEASGFACAVTTHAGVNLRSTDRLRLRRWMIDETTPVHVLVAEACGGFELLRRLGLDLSE